jgi:hypothetical protein
MDPGVSLGADAATTPARWPFPRLALGLPLVYSLHCLEEYTSFLDFARRHGITLPLANQTQLLAAMLALLAIIGGAALVATRATRPGDVRLLPWAVVFAMMYSHALVNVAGVALVGEYAPGAFVAGLVYLPFGIYMARRAWRERWLSGPWLVGVALAGAAGYVAMVAATLALGRAGGGS